VRERRAGADAELLIDTHQRGLDGVLAEEKGCRDLPVRAAFGDELRDPSLGLRQLAARGGTPTDARQLGARLLGPEPRPEPFEACESICERRAGGAALLRAPLRPPEHEQRPRVLERIRASKVFGERALEDRGGAMEIAPRGEQQGATAGKDYQCPCPSERARSCLPCGENLVGPVELVGGDERLEQITQFEAHSRLVHNRSDLGTRLGRREREVPSSFLGSRNDLRESSVQRPSAGGRLACSDCRSEQGIGEPQVFSVQLEDPHCLRLGQTGVGTATAGGLHRCSRLKVNSPPCI
jgi:hypothetical protein